MCYLEGLARHTRPCTATSSGTPLLSRWSRHKRADWRTECMCVCTQPISGWDCNHISENSPIISHSHFPVATPGQVTPPDRNLFSRDAGLCSGRHRTLGPCPTRDRRRKAAVTRRTPRPESGHRAEVHTGATVRASGPLSLHLRHSTPTPTPQHSGLLRVQSWAPRQKTCPCVEAQRGHKNI